MTNGFNFLSSVQWGNFGKKEANNLIEGENSYLAMLPSEVVLDERRRLTGRAIYDFDFAV